MTLRVQGFKWKIEYQLPRMFCNFAILWSFPNNVQNSRKCKNAQNIQDLSGWNLKIKLITDLSVADYTEK